jgi:hypothetical protein
LANHKILLLVKLIGQPIGAVEEKQRRELGGSSAKKERREGECQDGGRGTIVGMVFVVIMMTISSLS